MRRRAHSLCGASGLLTGTQACLGWRDIGEGGAAAVGGAVGGPRGRGPRARFESAARKAENAKCKRAGVRAHVCGRKKETPSAVPVLQLAQQSF